MKKILLMLNFIVITSLVGIGVATNCLNIKHTKNASFESTINLHFVMKSGSNYDLTLNKQSSETNLLSTFLDNSAVVHVGQSGPFKNKVIGITLQGKNIDLSNFYFVSYSNSYSLTNTNQVKQYMQPLITKMFASVKTYELNYGIDQTLVNFSTINNYNFYFLSM